MVSVVGEEKRMVIGGFNLTDFWVTLKCKSYRLGHTISLDIILKRKVQ